MKGFPLRKTPWQTRQYLLVLGFPPFRRLDAGPITQWKVARNQTDEVYASQHWLVLSAPRWSVLARPATPTGITSSAAQTNSTSYGIGYADFADANNPAGLSSGQIEIKYTLLGDANLDGVA
jgi:hypothetical protein